ncbi:hypothetical protein [Chloroflexus sp.]|uniref:hypothetical protein n=1 Tax=Chloroflexus sp. TaxID=1904827 RepID=UPI002ACDB49E|nr:hypothetical protein [Chloroflexus sp.]
MTTDTATRAFQESAVAALPWVPSRIQTQHGAAPALHLDLRRRPDVAIVLAEAREAARGGEPLEANALTTWRFGPGPDGGQLSVLEITLLDSAHQPRAAAFSVAFRRDDDDERQVAAFIAREDTVGLSDEPAPADGQTSQFAGIIVSVTSDLVGTLYQQRQFDALPELFPWRGLRPRSQAAYPAHWLPINEIATGDPQLLTLAGVAQRGSAALGLTLAAGLTPMEAGTVSPGAAGVWTLTPGEDGSRSLYMLETRPDGWLRLRWGVTLSTRRGADPTEELRRLWDRPMRYGVPPLVLLAALFLARTHRLPVQTATTWLTSLLNAMDTLLSLITAMEGGGSPAARTIVRGLEQHYRTIGPATLPARMLEGFTTWGKLLQAPSFELAATFDTLDSTAFAAALALVWAWGQELPAIHPASGDLSLFEAVLTRVDRALGATELPKNATWLWHPEAPIWLGPSMRGPVPASYGAEQLAMLRQVAAELVREANTGLPPVGRYRVRLPAAGLPELAQIGVAALEIDAQADGTRWLRLAPAEGEADGVIIPWQLAPEPPARWNEGGALSPRLVWELHLTLCAWERDMRREPAVRLRFVAPSAPADSTPPTPPRPKQRGRAAPGVLTLPREQVKRIELGPPPIEGDYAGDEEQQIERTLAAYHRVTDHAMHYRVARRASPAQRERFMKLPLAYRLAHYKVAELPEQGMTVRGLFDAPDGTVIRGYTRGLLADGDEEQPRPVVAQGLLAVRAALKLAAEMPQVEGAPEEGDGLCADN